MNTYGTAARNSGLGMGYGGQTRTQTPWAKWLSAGKPGSFLQYQQQMSNPQRKTSTGPTFGGMTRNDIIKKMLDDPARAEQMREGWMREGMGILGEREQELAKPITLSQDYYDKASELARRQAIGGVEDARSQYGNALDRSQRGGLAGVHAGANAGRELEMENRIFQRQMAPEQERVQDLRDTRPMINQLVSQRANIPATEQAISQSGMYADILEYLDALQNRGARMPGMGQSMQTGMQMPQVGASFGRPQTWVGQGRNTAMSQATGQPMKTNPYVSQIAQMQPSYASSQPAAQYGNAPPAWRPPLPNSPYA